MLNAGPATKVIIHLNEDTASPKDFLYKELFSFLFEQGVAGATMFRPESGFGSHHRIHSAEREQGHSPVRIEFIESYEQVRYLLPRLSMLVTDGLIELQNTTIYKSAAAKDRQA